METTPDRSGTDIDPSEQLAMFESIQSATEAEAWTPSTPVWHAPLFAASITGFALVDSASSRWAIAGPVIGGLALLIALVDHYRRRTVTPGRVKNPLRVLVFYGVILTVTLGIVVAWQRMAVTDSSHTAAVGWAWLVTTSLFAGGITLTNRMSARWTAAPS